MTPSLVLQSCFTPFLLLFFKTVLYVIRHFFKLLKTNNMRRAAMPFVYFCLKQKHKETLIIFLFDE